MINDLFKATLEFLRRRGADYADLRFERLETETVRVRNGVVEGSFGGSSSGVGIRVLCRGSWGFAATNLLDGASLEKAASDAFTIAVAFASANAGPRRVAERAPRSGSYVSPRLIDPFKVPLDDKIALLAAVTASAASRRRIAVSEAFMEFTRAEKEFYSTDGAEITQDILVSGGGYHVIAEDGREVQTRSYPDGHHGLFRSAGYEVFAEIDMLGSVERVTEEAALLLQAEECPAGVTDVILDSSQMALQIHESAGHPAELDRALGSETSFAGRSFLLPAMLGNFRYGSRLVNIYADPNCPGGAGSYGYDDEGVEGRRVELVTEGLFTGYLTSRESAAVIGDESNGAMRAASWSGLPLVRMNNICMAPGSGTLDDIIADTRDGLFLSTNRSWSIDDMRLNFQFGTELAKRIKNGRVVGYCRNPVYHGITPEFWASCDAVAGRGDWRLWGLNSCGKGEPMQSMNVGHGASPARFRGVKVGAAR